MTFAIVKGDTESEVFCSVAMACDVTEALNESALQAGHPEHLGGSSEAAILNADAVARGGTPNVGFWPGISVLGNAAIRPETEAS
jgi:hypothetical protein